MRRGMAEHKESIGISFREDLQLDVVIQRAAQVDQFAFTVVGRATRATRAASASRGEILLATSAGVVPLGTSLTLPSGNVM